MNEGKLFRGVMLFYHINTICKGSLWIMLFLFGCAGYAYRVNSKRPAEDPKKKNFHRAAIFLAPITVPIFIFTWITLFAIRALLYGVFLLLFTVGLVVIRKPFLFIWLGKMAAKVGTMLLEANTLLIRLFLPQLNERHN